MAERGPASDSRAKSAPAPAAAGASPAKPPVDATDTSREGDVRDKMLGEFRLLRRLGRGGMADVFLAEQTSLHRNVAVKVLRSDLLKEASYLSRFQREASAAAGLNHPNIVQVYTVGEQEGVYFIAQEYVQGQNLREFLVRKGPPELPLALLIMRQVASALSAAHEAQIVHRDIKPENIMLTRRGEVKVADFGLAKSVQRDGPVNLTQVGTTMGTPLYMSPEQVNGSTLDQRSDLYSFGVTCYHMLAGVPPFRGETAMSVAVQHLKEEAKPLAELRPDLPVELCQLVHKLMAKSADERFQSAAAVLKDLKRIGQAQGAKKEKAAEEPAAATVAELSPAAPRANRLGALGQFLDRPLRRQVPKLVLFGLLVMGVAAAIGWLLRPANPLANVAPAVATSVGGAGGTPANGAPEGVAPGGGAGAGR